MPIDDKFSDDFYVNSRKSNAPTKRPDYSDRPFDEYHADELPEDALARFNAGLLKKKQEEDEAWRALEVERQAKEQALILATAEKLAAEMLKGQKK